MRFVCRFVSVVLLAAAVQARGAEKDEQLKFVLVLARHGVRPPLVSLEQLHQYSSDAWPAWEALPGQLTPHGAEAIARMGAYMRLDMARSGLFRGSGCPAPEQVYLYSDTDQRNLDSTRANFAAWAPGCAGLAVHAMSPVSLKDPLFQPVPHTFPYPPGDAAQASIREAAGGDVAAVLVTKWHSELQELAEALAPVDGPPPAKPLLAIPGGPLPASTLVEDFQLEYEDGWPMNRIGWGRMDEQKLRRLIPLQVYIIGVLHRNRVSARAFGSNTLTHVVETLEQAASGTAVAGAVGPPGTKLVYLSGHDLNMWVLSGLLGLHWKSDGLMDDTPVDSQLIFELWQRRGQTDYDVRVRFRGQTLGQLRSAEELTLANGPEETTITPVGCVAGQRCSFAAFRKAAMEQVDMRYVKAEVGPVAVVP